MADHQWKEIYPRSIQTDFYKLPDKDDLPGEHAVLDFCKRLWEEGCADKESRGINKRVDNAAKFIAGDGQWPSDVYEKRRHFAAVVFNITRSVIERKAGMMTEARAQLECRSFAGSTSNADTLTSVLKAQMSEQSAQQVITDGVIMAQRNGHAFAELSWDQSLDFGRGDIGFEFRPSDEVVFDSHIRRAANLQRKAEWLILRTARPLAEFYERYGQRGLLVKPDEAVSQYQRGGIIRSPLQKMMSIWRKPSSRPSEVLDSAVPRAVEYQLYFRDRTLNPEQPFHENNTPNYIFPRKRVICWAGDTLLRDRGSQYWDGMFPGELLDWGIEVEHPYGESEVDQYRSMQMAINGLFAGLVNNARLINNPPKLVQGWDPPEIEELETYGDQPGRVWNVVDINSILDRTPNAMGPVVLAVVQALIQGIELLSGMTDVTAGKKPKGVDSGVALDTLLVAAQTVVRLQGRALEDFLTRIGHLMISRVIQFYTGKRIMHYAGSTGEVLQALFDRVQFTEGLMLGPDGKPLPSEERDKKLQDLFQDYTVICKPESGLAIARTQKVAMTAQLTAQGYFPQIRVLEALGEPDPEGTLAAARKDQAERAQLAAQIRVLAGGPMPANGGGAKGKLKSEDIPTSQRAGAGVASRSLT